MLIPPALNRAVAIATDVLRQRAVRAAAGHRGVRGAARERHAAASAAVDPGRRLHQLVSLTDRTFTGRHLPPRPPRDAALPSEADVLALFRRRERGDPSTDTSVMFMFFAQWFTDSFLRTSRDRLAEEHLDPGDRPLPDLRAVGGRRPGCCAR